VRLGQIVLAKTMSVGPLARCQTIALLPEATTAGEVAARRPIDSRAA
jgi:hypothetical protein